MMNASSRRALLAAAAIATALTMAGCSSTPADQPPLGRVSGTITMDGKPLANVDIVFAPEKGRPSVATTDKDGRYELSYINTTRGAKVGPHKVYVRPAEITPDETSSGGVNAVAAASPQVKIPSKYNKRSELTADVKAGRNTIDFALESK